MINRQLKKSERKLWNAWPSKKSQIYPLEAVPKRSEEAGEMQLNTWKKKAQSEYSIRQQELEMQRKEQEARARPQDLQIELPRKQTERQGQISQALMTMMQNLVKK